MKNLKVMHYKNHMDEKKIEDRIGIALWSLKMYGYISSKTKNYQIQIGFLQLFIFLGYQIVPSSHMPLGYTI